MGLSADLFDNEDKMNLHLVNIIKKQIGAEFMMYITPHFDDYEEERALVVVCQPSRSPVYLKEGNLEKFYVRTGASTSELLGQSMQEYIRQRFWGRLNFMPNELFDQTYDYAITAFSSLLNVKARPFGRKQVQIVGFSDNVEGVQWNLAIDKESCLASFDGLQCRWNIPSKAIPCRTRRAKGDHNFVSERLFRPNLSANTWPG